MTSVMGCYLKAFECLYDFFFYTTNAYLFVENLEQVLYLNIPLVCQFFFVEYPIDFCP